MKIRSGFVSNSSSSSFIVAFPSVPNTVEELQEMIFGDEKIYPNPYIWEANDRYGWPAEEVAETVWKDLQSRGTITREQALEAAQNGYLDEADRPEYPSHTIQDPELRAKAWDEYSAKSDAANRSVAEKFLDKVPEGHVLAEFEYSDNDGPYFTALEHGPLFMKLLHLRVSHH